ncbi:MAG: glycosyltransferase family 2 protein, partial [Chloroflexi bacterium]|nr:glycosyltransferase family 2 protein [Chloroflexota bacterium]
AAGNFRPSLLLEDSDLTLGLARAGYRTRFVTDAIAFTSVPETLSGYWRQHVRWSRGFQQVAGLQGGAVWRDARLPLGLRLELLAFALGYADRLALMAAAALTALDIMWPGSANFPLWLWLISFGVPFIQIVAALRLAPRKSPARMYPYLAIVPFFFALDLAMAAWSMAQTALRRPAKWTATERPLVREA